uniref:Fucosyltransferase n=1 Tax=Setaria digitata TaxID=48799 RepID=A0A915PQZ0_9BILA
MNGAKGGSRKFCNEPVILAWTHFFSSNLRDMLESNFSGKCDYRCIVTDDKRYIDFSDAIVFHIRDLNIHDLPKKRFNNQFYVFLLYESPHNTGLIQVPDNFFNLTMTYRYDSDIFDPYGILKKIDINTSDDMMWNWDEVKKIAINRKEMVLYLVSNCHTSSKREVYVKQLQNFLNITQRGKCNGIPCSDECARNLRANHRFYLAFENSVCEDYVTEKVFTNMENLLVPIVLKKDLYSNILPTGSYIAADEFKSPRELARYLEFLSQNTSAYLKYLEWTKYYQKPTRMDASCALCKYLHEHVNDIKPKIIHNIRSWWFDGNCIPDYALRLLAAKAH